MKFILWVPASMMMIIAIAIVIHDWNLTEEKRLRQGYGYSGPEYAAPEAEGQGNGDRTRVGIEQAAWPSPRLHRPDDVRPCHRDGRFHCLAWLTRRDAGKGGECTAI
ncbi:hypothetical protein [Aurantimonas marina]|uniref:hypothetical protein n=1 Tax=Aurantimonas marina TaxID=2780508 RepID=UPI0019D1539D|nr:hypothetical protein [Aurantimonas marina]